MPPRGRTRAETALASFVTFAIVPPGPREALPSARRGFFFPLSSRGLMIATLCLLIGVPTPGQVLPSSDNGKGPPTARRPAPKAVRPVGARGTPSAAFEKGWVLVPKLRRNQEIVYRGTFQETSRSGAAQLQRNYRVLTRLFVLDTPPKGAVVASLTSLKPVAPPGSPGGEPWMAVRLERTFVDLQGGVRPDGVTVVPLEGPPGVEWGMFVPVPGTRGGRGDSWEVAEKGRPIRTWRIAGPEVIQGIRCVKLEGVQQSDDWESPRADHVAWQRRDTVWLDPGMGIAYRVERLIRRRDPGKIRPDHQSLLRYERESLLPYPGRLARDRRQEIEQALAFARTLEPLRHEPAHHTRTIDGLLRRINYHLENQPPTPYRTAVLQVKRQAEAARRGETPPAPPRETTGAPTVAELGRKAPDFLVPDLVTRRSTRLYRLLGKPVLLVFYHPAAPTAETVLRFAQELASSRYDVTVLGLSVSNERPAAKKQRDDLGLTFPLLDGSGLRASYQVKHTPRFVLLDGKGYVRGTYLGWGQETPSLVVRELRRWLPALGGHRHEATKPPR
jgi:peroxiredoxin